MFFELDDIKRRHSPYSDVYNVHGWIDTPDSDIGWTLKRTSVAGLAGSLFSALHLSFLKGYKDIRTKYDPPKDIKQKFAYLKNIPKTQGYRGVRFPFFHITRNHKIYF